MHIVYLVRPGDNNEELRYSLRSLANLPHDRVWVAGHRPAWCTAHHIPTEQAGTKHANAYGNLRAALAHPDVPDEFILFNDDFFVTAPLDRVPTLHRGPVTQVLAQYRAKYRTSNYIDAMQATHDWLVRTGYRNPLSYELHTPMVLHRPTLTALLDRAQADGVDVTRLHYRTAYGNIAGVGGDKVGDVKVYHHGDTAVPTPLASTLDATFTRGGIGRALRAMYPDPSPYER